MGGEMTVGRIEFGGTGGGSVGAGVKSGPALGEWCNRTKLRELCALYDHQVKVRGFGRADSPQKADTSRMDRSIVETFRHLRWMLSQIPDLRDEGKVNRWLGFVQGVLSALGMYTVDEMRKHVTEARG